MEKVYSAALFAKEIFVDEITVDAPVGAWLSDKLETPRLRCMGRDVSEELAAIASARNNLESVEMQMTDEQAKAAISEAVTMLGRYADALRSIVGSVGVKG